MMRNSSKKIAVMFAVIISIAIIFLVIYKLKDDSIETSNNLNVEYDNDKNNFTDTQEYKDYLSGIDDNNTVSTENKTDYSKIWFDLDKDNVNDYELEIADLIDDKPIDPILTNMSLVKHKYMNEYTYDLNLSEEYGKLKLTFHEVIDSGILYYVEYIPYNKKSKSLSFSIEASKADSISVTEGYYENHVIKYNIHDVTSSQNFNNIFNLVDGDKNHIMLGRVFLEKDIGETVKSVTKIKQDNSIIMDDKNTYRYVLPVKNGYSTKVNGMVALNNLINDKSVQFNLATLSALDLADVKYVWADGIYYDNPSTYKPSAKNDFYRTACGTHMRGCYWVLDQGSIFTTYGVSLMYTYADLYNDKNYIPTVPRSDWLYDDYKINGEFYDTRFNTDTISSFLHMQEVYPDEKIKEVLDEYFEFYIDFVDNNSFYLDGNIFIADYMDYDGNEIMPHCSLNHMLSEMTVMYRYHLLYQDDKLFDLAEKFLHSIMNTKDNWIKPNGDLYYCITKDGEYTRQDYKLVTLNDLDRAKYYLKLIYKEVPDDYMVIYNSKKDWAVKNGYKN
ncbi:hypothetical protein SH1V18_23800 [Vallitalea longa]|uniref:D-glucuronyl C5-epimerase C-terminal domain-containing protein n=1 Tax=Vallitalea longa TaxID=2936439 RepID=A0A9W5YC58_9FIRM|nr:hypothetical protein [Vallitalea longa]GKX29900.1 hypothetical protein SH1V18_23800 [Vallitalea longa]